MSKIILKGEFNLCDEFPTKKFNFDKLCKELIKKGYQVEEKIVESMGSLEKNEISIILDKDKEIKLFTSSDPYAKDAILDSDLYSRLSDVIKKVEQLLELSQPVQTNN